MKQMVGNPQEVDNGEGDFSMGWDDSTPNQYECEVRLDEDRRNDVNRLVQMFADAGYQVEPAVAWYAWSEVSMSVHAHWLMLDSSANHVESMLRFLIEKEPS